MVKYCVANECPISDVCVCICCPRRSSRGASNTYTKKAKRLGIFILPLWRLKMAIFTYSNILLSVSLINILVCVLACSHERPLGLFEVLARNRQSAVGRLPSRIDLRTHRQPPRMFTIPPRQQLSSPILSIRLAIRGRNFTHLIINTHTKREKERERKRNTKPSLRIIKSDSAFFIRQ